MQTLTLTLVATVLTLLLALHNLLNICMIINKEIWVEKCFKKIFRNVPYDRTLVLFHGRLFLFLLPAAVNAFSLSYFMATIPIFRYLFLASPLLTTFQVIQLHFKYSKAKKDLNDTEEEISKFGEED